VYALFQPIDVLVLRQVSALVDALPSLGSVLGAVLTVDLVKGAIPLAGLWLLWLSPASPLDARCRTIACSLGGLVGAIMAGRAGQLLLPFRQRPLFDPMLAGELPHPGLAIQFDGWSAFPSDHGSLAGALIAAAFTLSRPGGLAMSVWLLTLVCLPRLYFGLHWPSDVAAGLALGFGITALALRVGLPQSLVATASRLVARRQPQAVAALFLVSFEIASLFASTRQLGRSMARLVGVDD
jgi:undecaprenyl-diphosphatase